MASRFETEIVLPAPRGQVFEFFSNAANLETLTPPWLSFEIVTPQPIDMLPGARIEYRLRIHGFPMGWTSVISAWEPPDRFVDEQVKGPYRTWIHEHAFEDAEPGTRVIDRVTYAVPGGALVDRLFVRRDIDRIFAYRHARLAERFGVESAS